uniref:NADH-ubiquinone oxidoreductase chain 4L n=1 Tax=Pityophthorus pubescens TaxID=471227 RepID=A0A343A6I0_9CUCU|nr:NADH dehydrogenase subunit 4L [Pityophthorus pubescens]AOY40159.1 NADH dehydrogenase subunit 4L [Pityophthorus pubescens]
MYYQFYLYLWFFFSGLFIFVSKYKHFLIMLLSLEFLVLSLYMMFFIYFSQGISDYFVSMFYLSMSVCEGALGLSLLVLMIRTHGGDMIMLFDSLW